MAPNQNLTDNRKFRKKVSVKQRQVVENSLNCNWKGEGGGDVLKQENSKVNRAEWIDLKGIYARITKDELLHSDTSSSPPTLRTVTSSFQNSSVYLKVVISLDGSRRNGWGFKII